MGPMLDALDRRGVRPASVLLQSYALADCRLARSRGWDVIWLGTTDVDRATAEDIRWIGPTADRVTATVCARAHAAGVEVACHTVNRRHVRDALIADGVDALFSDDPVYIAGDAGLRTADLFARQVWLPGMLPDNGRGRFHPDDSSWGCDASDAVASTLIGFLAPPDPTAFTLDLDLRVDEFRAEPAGCGGSVLLSTDDHPYRPPGASPGVHGYQVVLRGDGNLEVHRVTDGLATVLASSTGGTSPPRGAYVPLRITVTSYGLAVRAGTVGATVSVADVRHRPVPVVHLGSVRAGVRFRNVEVA
jgi:glycerophosphoryl diester phosphodiesterase